MKSLLTNIVLCFFLTIPSLKSAEIVGFYSDGELWDASSVLDRNPRFQKLFLGRKKHYTSDEMRRVLQELADYVKANFPDSEVLQVGDLSARGGGPAPRHVSHQNGIDADLVYLRVDKNSQSPREPEWAESFVKNAEVTPNFDFSRNWRLLKHIVERYDVGRIFVDRAIKKAFCEFAESNRTLEDKKVRAFLRRLRPARYHDTHFHIRLKCPEGHPRCDEQHEPPPGPGCSEAELDVKPMRC